MLIRSAETLLAQPTSTTAQHTRRLLSAAGSVLAAIIAILLPLALSEDSAAAASGSGAWPWPLLGEVITPYKNGSDPYAAGQHRGLDIAAPAGTPVLAIVDGRVSFSGRLPDGGETVTVASSDGRWLVSDLHLSERSVRHGAAVHAGEMLGRVGATGRRSATEPHLHLGVRRADTRAYVDPMSLLGAPRLASAPTATPEPAAAKAQPAAPAVHVGARRPHITPLEQGSRHMTKVHAQPTGDISSASRHGAGSVATRNPADVPAREGHAAEKATGRVAPPPLTAPFEEPQASDRAVQHEIAAPANGHARNDGSSKRALLLAIAAVCLLALALRRAPESSSRTPAAAAPERSQQEPGQVIAIDGKRRSA